MHCWSRCPNLISAVQRPWWAHPGEGDLHSLEEVKEAIGFQEHAQEGPAQEHNDHAPQEEAGPLELVPLEEEGKRLPQADDEGEAGQEQQLWEREGVGVRTNTLAPSAPLGVRGQAWSCLSGMGQDLLTLQGGTILERVSNLNCLGTEVPRGRVDRETFEGL